MRRYSVFLWVLLVLSVFLVSNVGAYEYGVDQFDNIEFLGGNGPNGGGEFNWQAQDDGYTFASFCLEKNEYISSGGIYSIGSITDRAINGGNNVETNAVDPLDTANGIQYSYDPISNATAWLFWNFSRGALRDYDGSATMQGNLQNLIWWLEDESENIIVNSTQAAWLNGYYDAIGPTLDGWINNGRVMVLNLFYDNDGTMINSQDQLIAAAPVPEPETMVLLGIGLLFVAGISRKKRKP
jgi:PEP-CTERM motif-containing protein